MRLQRLAPSHRRADGIPLILEFITSCLLVLAPEAASPQSSAHDISAEPLRSPLEYRSVNGVLAVTIFAAETRVRLGNRMIEGSTFNGTYAGPILRRAG